MQHGFYSILIILLLFIPIITLVLGCNNLILAKKTVVFSREETIKELHQVIHKKCNHWRWIAITFAAIGIPSIIIIGSLIYNDYYWRHLEVEGPMNVLPVEEVREELIEDEAL